MNIYFEAGGNYITASTIYGKVVIRCNFEYTDCREDESLDEFIKRHGGETKTTNYLKKCYSDATKI